MLAQNANAFQSLESSAVQNSLEIESISILGQHSRPHSPGLLQVLMLLAKTGPCSDQGYKCLQSLQVSVPATWEPLRVVVLQGSPSILGHDTFKAALSTPASYTQ